MDRQTLRATVEAAVRTAPLTDIHTHLYAPAFGDLLLWGVDELLTYHYLVAETLRWAPISYEAFWALSKREQADLVWRTLFIENTPYSEACRGVLTAFQLLGLDTSQRDLEYYRNALAGRTMEEQVDIVLQRAGVEHAVMTNDPFDLAERAVWLKEFDRDPRFHAALRLDRLLINWTEAVPTLQAWGYGVDTALSAGALQEVRRFLTDWIGRMKPLYMAVSLGNDFTYPEDSACNRIIEQAILPVAREQNLPLALMIGVKRQVNPALRLAGDASGRADVAAVERLCAAYPANKFLVTMLSRENQHELIVMARKFRNLMIFGCWWFMNNPSLVTEITRMRFELLGASVIPQHSDARVLEQVLYKWEHSRQIIIDVLTEKYADLLQTGWRLEPAEIERDARKLLGGNFWAFLER